MYFRNRFSSFEEFKRQAWDHGGRELGKDELELLEELQSDDEFYKRPNARKRRSPWD
jgi:hypothetical protein